MPVREYAVDGDQGFIGLNSRDNPANIGKNFVANAQNIRMDRGVATVRKGAERLTVGALLNVDIFGSCTYTRPDGEELIVLVLADGLHTYNPDTDAVSIKVLFPAGETIDSTDEVDVYQAKGLGSVYILRGFGKSTLRWDGASTIVTPSAATHHNYPNGRHALYYGNRHIVQSDRNTIQVSHYLEDNNWSSLDMFTINDGGNDRLIAIAPWTLNEFVIFMRNSIFYASVGVGATSVGDPAQDGDSYIKSLATDIGCIARGSVVQAGGGILFLSDNGVYFLNPAGASAGQGNTPEGMRLLTLAEPLSAPIEDFIQRINYNHADKAVAIYWENRYYLSVPLDDSDYNNVTLVYNFINKAWESVDTYPQNVAVSSSFIDETSADIAVQPLYWKYNATDPGLLGFNLINHDTSVAAVNQGIVFSVIPSSTLNDVEIGDYLLFGNCVAMDFDLAPYQHNDALIRKFKVADKWQTTPASNIYFVLDTGVLPGLEGYQPAFQDLTINEYEIRKTGSLTIKNWAVAKRGNRRRLFSIDQRQGISLMESLDWDEHGASIGKPVLPIVVGIDGEGKPIYSEGDFKLDETCILDPLAYTPVAIRGALRTRAYTFDTMRDKRFSRMSVDVSFPAGGGDIVVNMITTNPDTEGTLIKYESGVTEDVNLKLPVRKTAYYCQADFTLKNLRPSIRSISVEATPTGINTQTKK